jgi:hypothetical protein
MSTSRRRGPQEAEFFPVPRFARLEELLKTEKSERADSFK